jgi:hypothetical protein
MLVSAGPWWVEQLWFAPYSASVGSNRLLPVHPDTPHPAFGHPLPSRARGEGMARSVLGPPQKNVANQNCESKPAGAGAV